MEHSEDLELLIAGRSGGKKLHVFKCLGKFMGKKKSIHSNQILMQNFWYRESLNCLERILDKCHSVLVLFLHFTASIYYFQLLEGAKPSIPMI